MRIGISCNALRPSGGFERYAMDLVRALARRGDKPWFFARKFDTSVPEYALVHPVGVNAPVPGKLRDLFCSRRVVAAKARLGIDLLIGCNRTRGADIAVCGGTHRGYLRAEERFGKPSDWLQARLEQQHYDGARFVVAHSRLMAGELRELYGVGDDRLRVLHPPVDASRFAPPSPEARAALRRELGWRDDQVVFLFPSSSHRRKGLPLLRAFFERTALPVLLAVVGREVDRPGRNIASLGYRRDIEKLYGAADYSLLASTYEPFGLVGVESVLCGTPTVLAGNIACTEVLDDAACLRFDRTDPASLAAAIAGAVERARDGRHRLADPAAHFIDYDPDIDRHLAALLALAPPCPSAST
ncbi:glycosyltransferase family 4 protein [Derxia gummosa]|uniref:Glycosyltransferase family 4 protein n=1 Tax=Derxia gummosa DSM 723 TaxID=1121388 RepID=A0A8B6X335_9BURK|nr:glycosyltransferase family 4 protein [Derxia gummosa]